MTRVLRGKRTPAWHEVEANQVEAKKEDKDDSNRPSQANGSVSEAIASRISSYSPYIAALASDFSRELEDSAHEASNMRQALNLWQSSGTREEEFVALMHQARKLTRKYQARPTWDAMHNKMAYFFATLRDLCVKRDA
jgi:hypothetical protein